MDTTNAALAAKIRELHARGSDGWADLSNLLEINAIVLAEALERIEKAERLIQLYRIRYACDVEMLDKQTDQYFRDKEPK